jgi:hypothetical protein
MLQPAYQNTHAYGRGPLTRIDYVTDLGPNWSAGATGNAKSLNPSGLAPERNSLGLLGAVGHGFDMFFNY